MSDIVSELLGFAPFIMIIFVVGFVMRASVQHGRNRVELQKEILGKFSSGQELSDFLATDAGKRLMRETKGSQWASKNRVITLAVAGLVATGAGLGFYFGGNDSEAVGIFTGVGVALLVSSAVTFWLARRLGLSDTPVETSLDQ